MGGWPPPALLIGRIGLAPRKLASSGMALRSPPRISLGNCSMSRGRPEVIEEYEAPDMRRSRPYPRCELEDAARGTPPPLPDAEGMTMGTGMPGPGTMGGAGIGRYGSFG